MYKHILIPTDGSDFSTRAALTGVRFAQEIGARLTALTVTAPWQSMAVGELALAVPEADYEERAAKSAASFLEPILSAAQAAGVPAEGRHVRSPNPYEAIVEAATARGCDLIYMGSHGRRGLAGFLIGSETVRVLTHSSIPVLVYRQ